MKFNKYENNPILFPLKEHQWENFCVLNPGVIYDEESKKFIMLYRAAGDDIKHKICLGLAVSEDGFNFTRCSDQPSFNPPETGVDGGCAEDPRIVKIDDYFYITYAARAFCPGRYWLPSFKEERAQWFKPQKDTVPSFYRINHTVTYLAMTKDFVNYVRLGRITDSRIDDRDVVIFPRKINGKFVRISRPAIDGHYYMEIAFSDDLLEWGPTETLYKGIEYWENYKSQYIFGIKPVREGLSINPKLPSHIKEADIERIYRGTKYYIHVINKGHNNKYPSLFINNEKQDGHTISCKDKEIHITCICE